jgi:hypothetical protein
VARTSAIRVEGGASDAATRPPLAISGHDRSVLDLPVGTEQDEAVCVRLGAEDAQLATVERADDLPADELVGPCGRRNGRLAAPPRAEVDLDHQGGRPRTRVLVGGDDATDDQVDLLQVFRNPHHPLG